MTPRCGFSVGNRVRGAMWIGTTCSTCRCKMTVSNRGLSFVAVVGLRCSCIPHELRPDFDLEKDEMQMATSFQYQLWSAMLYVHQNSKFLAGRFALFSCEEGRHSRNSSSAELCLILRADFAKLQLRDSTGQKTYSIW
jgi:hypothetical protein